MAVTTADLDKAINAVWDAQSLDTLFTVYWSSGQIDDFIVLHDQEAQARTPLPYCVYVIGTGSTTTRMTGHDKNERHEIRDIPVSFRVHAKQSGGNTAKSIAADLIEEIMKVFGGHPSSTPESLTLDNGIVLISQYQSDFGINTGDEEHQWSLNYLFRVDVPVAA